MNKQGVWAVVLVVVAMAAMVAASCSDKGETTSPPVVATLTAAPASASVSQGQTVNVAVSGGTAPYHILTHPDPALATAALQDSAMNPVTLMITGVSVATGSTSVRVGDSSPSSQKQVTVAITKVP